MRQYIHPTEEKVAINKALLARVIEHLEVDKYDQEKRTLVYQLEELLESDELKTISSLKEEITGWAEAYQELDERYTELENNHANS